MSAKNVRDLKRSRQFALPKITKQHSPRDNAMNDSFPMLAQQKYLTISGDRYETANRSHAVVKNSNLDGMKRKSKGSSMKQNVLRKKGQIKEKNDQRLESDVVTIQQSMHENISIQYQNTINDSIVSNTMETTFKSNKSSLENFINHIGDDADQEESAGGDSEPTQCEITDALLRGDEDIQITKFLKNKPL